MLLATTPTAYAKHLSRYISDASTVRARVMDEYGRAPSVDSIREMQDRARASAIVADDDGVESEDFRVTGIVDIGPTPKVQPPEKKAAPATPLEIIADIARRMNVDIADMTGPGRRRFGQLARALHLAAGVLRARGNSYPQIGKWLGGRDHSTIINLDKKLPRTMAKHPEIAKLYQDYMAQWAESKVRTSGSTPRRGVRNIPCTCVETGMVFHSMAAAAEWLRERGHVNAMSSGLSKACVYNTMAYGHHWVSHPSPLLG